MLKPGHETHANQKAHGFLKHGQLRLSLLTLAKNITFVADEIEVHLTCALATCSVHCEAMANSESWSKDVCVQDMRKMLKDRLSLVLFFLGAREEPAEGTVAWTVVPLDRKALEELAVLAPLAAEPVAESVEKGWIAEALGIRFQTYLEGRSSLQCAHHKQALNHLSRLSV